ncbi:hypothetical protein H257_06343 [Aphanomyces astaci]|uniref:Uncharacterized protein n=1 Tax=Aphanomyces astaci TaxID=112090 RepID=W4GPE1_APHAT|nr:hypothetical protein H257_06343 [Aphanomyces astaci]ETV80889.1 hypothetical protein H257_06343 [Aphanomyces astaci]|eukprot:XP_009829836.1 hypothetical protein H257_06343 [Aphanomyces astaci]
MTLLSWKEFAQAFQTDRNMVEHQHRCLQKQVAALESPQHMLLLWFTSTHSPVHAPLLTYKLTSLLGDTTARSLGLDWISKHLYHNLDPDFLERCRDADHGDGLRYLRYASLNSQARNDSFHEMMLARLDGLVKFELQGNTQVLRYRRGGSSVVDAYDHLAWLPYVTHSLRRASGENSPWKSSVRPVKFAHLQRRTDAVATHVT